MEAIEGVNLPFIPIGGIQELKKNSSLDAISAGKSEFDKIFAEELNKLKFSAHAQNRLTSRDIDLNEIQVQRLEKAVSQIENKGGNESLILLDDKAFIVSIPNRTVITIIDKANSENKIFTNIDSAAFA